MLDNEDIKKLGEVFATKEQIKEMLKPLVTMEILEANNKKLVENFSEVFVTKTDLEGKVNRHEKWIGQIAKKVDIELES